MNCLSNNLLLDAYEKAKILQLDQKFINLLKKEIYERNLQKEIFEKIKL